MQFTALMKSANFIFFLLRKSVKVGGNDKGIHSARTLKWSKNLISQYCNYRTETMQDLSYPSPHPLAEPGKGASRTADDLKLSPLTRAWEMLLCSWLKPDSSSLEARQTDGGADILSQDLAAQLVCPSRWKPPCLQTRWATKVPAGRSRLAWGGSAVTASERGQMLDRDHRDPPTEPSRDGFSLETVQSRCDQTASQPDEKSSQAPGVPPPSRGMASHGSARIN